MKWLVFFLALGFIGCSKLPPGTEKDIQEMKKAVAEMKQLQSDLAKMRTEMDELEVLIKKSKKPLKSAQSKLY
jgi:hypothetical protein